MGDRSGEVDLERTAATEADLAFVRNAGKSSVGMIAAACERYPDRVCFGSVDASLAAGEQTTPPMTYRDLWDRVVRVARGLALRDLAGPGTFVGISGPPSAAWMIADLACLQLGAVSVPLQSKSSPATLRHIAEDAKLACVFCGSHEVGAMREALGPKMPLIVIDGDPDATDTAGLHHLHEVERIGREGSSQPFETEVDHADGKRLRALMYSSGSSGVPKGIMFTETMWRAYLQSALIGPPTPLLTVGYLPLSHMTGRFNAYRAVLRGGMTYFVGDSDMSMLFENIRRVRPTELFFVPRVLGMLFDQFKRTFIESGATFTSAAAAMRDPVGRRIMTDFRHTVLGDRFQKAGLGSAPTAPEVLAFFKECFDVPVEEKYGAMEFGIVTVNGQVLDGVSYRLVDESALGYSLSDEPYPRGELLVKTPFVTPGYWGKHAADALVRDADGYVRTGDIVEERGPNVLSWVDRKGNIIKLAQGKFVAISRLEELYASASPYFSSFYLYGNGQYAYLIALVVPDVAAIRAAPNGGSDAPLESVVRRVVRAELDRIMSEHKLQSHELPRDFILESEVFTKENGLLTDSNKINRPALKARYGERLERLYTEIEARRFGEDAANVERTTADEPLTVLDKVERAVAETIGLSLEEVQTARDRSFVSLGGDSLAGVRLREVIGRTCGASPPLAVVLDPQATIATMAAKVNLLLEAGGTSKS